MRSRDDFAAFHFNSMTFSFDGLIGKCGDREVFVGFAAAGTLVQLSYADVLNEATGQGYQRPFSREHSLEFKRYIQQPGASSMPLTFNLRSSSPSPCWPPCS